jgi:hypothetical protein
MYIPELIGGAFKDVYFKWMYANISEYSFFTENLNLLFSRKFIILKK